MQHRPRQPQVRGRFKFRTGTDDYSPSRADALIHTALLDFRQVLKVRPGRAYTDSFMAMGWQPQPVQPSLVQQVLKIRDEYDPSAPMKEAAMFYGLFLRGQPAEALRRDIDVPRDILEKWLRPRRHEAGFRESLRRIYQFRKQVLAIFDELVLNERNRARLVQ